MNLGVLRSREAGFLGSSLGGIGSFFPEGGALSPSSGLGERQGEASKRFLTAAETLQVAPAGPLLPNERVLSLPGLPPAASFLFSPLHSLGGLRRKAEGKSPGACRSGLREARSTHPWQDGGPPPGDWEKHGEELGSVATASLFVGLPDCGLDPTGGFSQTGPRGPPALQVLHPQKPPQVVPASSARQKEGWRDCSLLAHKALRI